MPRQIVLASRPSGWPTAANFRLTETVIDSLEQALEAFVRLLHGATWTR